MDFTKTIILLTLMASELIAHSAFVLMAIDSEPIQARGIKTAYDYFLFRCGASIKIFSCTITPFSCY